MAPVEVVKVNKDNYEVFDDMVCRRTGKERSRPLDPDVLEVLENPNLTVYAAEKNGRFVGWISIVHIPKVGHWKKSGHLYIDELWVEPDHRKEGIGAKLINTADLMFEKVKLDGMRLYVSMDNPAAIRLYEKHGFSIRDEAYFMDK